MPTYQYVCTSCGEDLEAVQSFTDAALTECPACHGTLRKRFSAVGVVFKGSGFYKTDSRSSGRTGGTDKREKSTASADSSSDSTSTATAKGSATSSTSSDKGSSSSTPAPAASTSSSSSAA